jgi:hypothetical protein
MLSSSFRAAALCKIAEGENKHQIILIKLPIPAAARYIQLCLQTASL